jgi:hypothetical protein
MNKWTSQPLDEARAIVSRLVKIQGASGWSDSRMVETYPELGSQRSWARWRAGDYSRSHPARTLMRLRRISAQVDGGTPPEDVIELPFLRELRKRVAFLERTTTDRRVLVVLAPNGTGKTTAARKLVDERRECRRYCRLRPGWRNKEFHIARGLLRAIGVADDAGNAAEAEERLVEVLSSAPSTVFLDQAHEGGAALMHLVRCLVDETPSRFVYLGYETAWGRVHSSTADAMVEARAFVGRCMKPLWLAYRQGTLPADVRDFLVASGWEADTAATLGRTITPVLQSAGNLRLLADGLEFARAAADSDDVTPEQLREACVRLSGLDPATISNQEDS